MVAAAEHMAKAEIKWIKSEPGLSGELLTRGTIDFGACGI